MQKPFAPSLLQIATVFVMTAALDTTLAAAPRSQDVIDVTWEAVAELPPGTPLRITVPDGAAFVGKLVEVRANEITLEQSQVVRERDPGVPPKAGRTYVIARANISKIELGEYATPTLSFDDLQRILRIGQSVIVVDTAGQKTRGKVEGITASSLTLQVAGNQASRTYDVASLANMSRRDSLKNGAWYGFGIGIVSVAALGNALCQKELEYCYAGAFGALVGAAIGPLVGALIDERINAPVYTAPSTKPRASVLPKPGKARRRVAVSSVLRSRFSDGDSPLCLGTPLDESNLPQSIQPDSRQGGLIWEFLRKEW